MIFLSDWVQKTIIHIEKIKCLKPESKLASIGSIMECLNAIYWSTIGWFSWVRNPKFMEENFTEQELQEIFEKLKEYAVKFLELDVEWTKKKEKSKKPEEPTQPPIV